MCNLQLSRELDELLYVGLSDLGSLSQKGSKNMQLKQNSASNTKEAKALSCYVGLALCTCCIEDNQRCHQATKSQLRMVFPAMTQEKKQNIKIKKCSIGVLQFYWCLK